MSPIFGLDDRFGDPDARRGACHGAEIFLLAGQCALTTAIAGFVGVLIFLLIK